MKHIGVIGASGFIGSNIVSCLSIRDFNVESYLRITNGLESFIKRNDIIIHAAGVNRGTHDQMVESNINFTFKIAELCNKYKKILIYLGTMYNKKDSYGFTKQIAENIIKSYIDNFSSDFYVMRLPNVLGNGCKPYYNSFLTTLIYEYAHGNKDIKLKIKDMQELITFVDIKDVCEAIVDLISENRYYKIFDYPLRSSLTFEAILELLEEPYSIHNQYFPKLLEYYKNYDLKK